MPQVPYAFEINDAEDKLYCGVSLGGTIGIYLINPSDGTVSDGKGIGMPVTDASQMVLADSGNYVFLSTEDTSPKGYLCHWCAGHSNKD